jgi:hypothetical protein
MNASQMLKLLDGRWKSSDNSYYKFTTTTEEDDWYSVYINPADGQAKEYHFQVHQTSDGFLLLLRDARTLERTSDLMIADYSPRRLKVLKDGNHVELVKT